MKKWEYLEKSDLKLKELNDLGKKGWELIHCYTHRNLNIYYYIFKREINK